MRILSLIFLLLPLGLLAQKPPTQRTFDFSLHPEWFEFLNKAYPMSMLEAGGSDIEVSFQKWGHMLQAMEAYGEEVGYDIRGMKMWLKVYFRADGTPDYLAYTLKPESAVYPEAELNAFFNGFMRRYKLPLINSVAYAHYGGASFPTFIGYPVGPQMQQDTGKK